MRGGVLHMHGACKGASALRCTAGCTGCHVGMASRVGLDGSTGRLKSMVPSGDVFQRLLCMRSAYVRFN